MKSTERTPFFLTAPSRSGSSLLTALLNCDPRVVTVNEPIIGLTVASMPTIEEIFLRLSVQIDSGRVEQRLKGGREPTDTYPNSMLTNGHITVQPDVVRAMGLKVSYPAFSDADAMNAFTRSWPGFLDWMIHEKRGRVIALVRNPLFTILSWKSTFEPLRGSTEEQCDGWNRISQSIMSEIDRVLLVRYEDVVADPLNELGRILRYLGLLGCLAKELPPIVSRNDITYYRTSRSVDVPEESLRDLVRARCGESARHLGYSI